jgi:hypothetical protein
VTWEGLDHDVLLMETQQHNDLELEVFSKFSQGTTGRHFYNLVHQYQMEKDRLASLDHIRRLVQAHVRVNHRVCCGWWWWWWLFLLLLRLLLLLLPLLLLLLLLRCSIASQTSAIPTPHSCHACAGSLCVVDH